MISENMQMITIKLILTSSFKEEYGLGDNILKKFIIKYNKMKNLK